MHVSIRKLAANLPLNGQNSLHSAIDSIEQLGSELILLCAQSPDGSGLAFNYAIFKRRGLGNPPPTALHLSQSTLPPADQDANIDPNGDHTAHTLIGAGPVWIDGALKLVSAWRG